MEFIADVKFHSTGPALPTNIRQARKTFPWQTL